MPVDLREIASITGMPGLYRILSPTRSGVIIETLADYPVRSAAQAKHRISLLHDISIYTNDPDVTVPLADIFERIRQKYDDKVPVNAKSANSELTAFMEEILPDYDRERVYISDIKKIATWYALVKKHLPFNEAAKQPTDEKSKEAEAKTGEEEESKKTKKSAE